MSCICSFLNDVIHAPLPYPASTYSQPKRKVAPTSSERLSAATKVGGQSPMPWSLKPSSLLVPPPRHPREHSRATALNGAQIMSRQSEVWLRIIPHPQGFPTVWPWLQAFGKCLPLLPSTSSCKEAPTSFVHPNAFELCSAEQRAENAHLQSCLPEEHLEDVFGRFSLQISFQVIMDLAMEHLANPQRTQIKTPRSPAP